MPNHYYRCRPFLFFFLCIISLPYSKAHAFAGEQHKANDDVSKRQELFYLCKVWGYLNYYQPPIVAQGALSREDVLRNSIEKILSSSLTATTRSSSINSMVMSLLKDFGVPPATASVKQNFWDRPGMIRHTDFRWLQDSVFDNETQTKLEAVAAMSLPLQSFHYLEKGQPNERIIAVKPDMLRTSITKTESLLSLFALWNAVNYLSPHKELCAGNWDTLLVEYIPQFQAVATNADYVRLVMKFCSRWNDSHAVISSPAMESVLGKYTIPLRFVILDSSVVVQETFCCDSLNLKGWIVEEINGTPIDSLVQSYSALVSASNNAVRKREIARKLRYSKQSESLAVLSNGKEKQRLTIDCSQPSTSATQQGNQQTTYYQFIENQDKDTLVYVDLSRAQKNDVPTMFRILAGKAGVIFDLRKYPNFIMYDVMQQLVHPTSFGSISAFMLQFPGYHSVPAPLSCGKKQEYFGNVVVLVNEWTQSRGEFTAQAMRTIPNMKIVGSQTAGADGDIIKIVLPMNVTVHFTVAAVFDRTMKSMQGVGILPDVEVHPTIAGIRAGRDEVLEKGIEVLQQLIKQEAKPFKDK